MQITASERIHFNTRERIIFVLVWRMCFDFCLHSNQHHRQGRYLCLSYPFRRRMAVLSAHSKLLVITFLIVNYSQVLQGFECSSILTSGEYRAFSCDVIPALLEGKNNTFSLLWEIRSIFMQNSFIVSALQHDCLYCVIHKTPRRRSSRDPELTTEFVKVEERYSINRFCRCGLGTV